jgi:hypothetical protein
MAASCFSNTPDLEGVHAETAAQRIFLTKLPGKAGRIGIFALEAFPHESGSKPLTLAQIRRLEVPVSLFSPKHRPSEPPNLLFCPPFPRLPVRPPPRSTGTHPIHISNSAIAALPLPLDPSAIWRVMVMGAPTGQLGITVSAVGIRRRKPRPPLATPATDTSLVKHAGRS